MERATKFIMTYFLQFKFRLQACSPRPPWEKLFFVNIGICLRALKAFLLLCEKSKCEKISIYKCKHFRHLMWICFSHSAGANSIETILETCNVWTNRSVSYKSVNWFLLNLPHHQNGKNKSTSKV